MKKTSSNNLAVVQTFFPKKQTLISSLLASALISFVILLPALIIHIFLFESLFNYLFPFFSISTLIFVGIYFLPNKKINAPAAFSLSSFFMMLFSFLLITRTYLDQDFTVDLSQSISSNLLAKNITMENSNPIKPSYQKYYQSLNPSFLANKINAVLESFFIKEKTYNASLKFLQQLSIFEKNNKESIKDDFICKVTPTSDSKIIFFGDIQGAYNSLVRDFARLKELDLIDNDFKLKDFNNYIVFNGDVVSRSPYQLETLTLVLQVLNQNPENAFYLKGNHETNNYWHGFGLKDEIAGRIEKSKQEPVFVKLNNLFQSLPLALYFDVMPEPGMDFIRISHYGADRNPVLAKESENKFFNFLSAKSSDKKKCLPVVQARNESSENPIKLHAILKSEKKRDTYQDMDGMRMIQPENGVPGWTLLSCPTEVYQKGLKFFYDAFAIIQTASEIKDWTITLHKQDVRTMLGFETQTYFLTSGQNKEEAELSNSTSGYVGFDVKQAK